MHSALNPVQDVELIFLEELSSPVSFFYTEFSTSVLKSLESNQMSSKKPLVGAAWISNFVVV